MYHFYCFNQEKIILVSDLPVDKIKKKYGIRYEILTSIKERDSIVIIKERLKRSYSQFEFIEANSLYKAKDCSKRLSAI